MATITVLDSAGATQTIQVPNASGQLTTVNSRSIVPASDSPPFPIIDPDTVATGSLAILNATVSLNLQGDSNFALRVDGTFVGTITIERSIDGVTFDPINAAFVGVGTLVQAITVPGSMVGYAGPSQVIRARMTAFTSGSAAIVLRAGSGCGASYLVAPLPSGANVPGVV